MTSNIMSKNIDSYLEIILGGMYAGKTSRLVEIYKQCNFCNISVDSILPINVEGLLLLIISGLVKTVVLLFTGLTRANIIHRNGQARLQ